MLDIETILPFHLISVFSCSEKTLVDWVEFSSVYKTMIPSHLLDFRSPAIASDSQHCLKTLHLNMFSESY